MAVKLLDVGGVQSQQRQMPPEAVDDPQLASWDKSLLAVAVRIGTTISSSTGITKVFTFTRPSAAARSPSGRHLTVATGPSSFPWPYTRWRVSLPP